MRLVCPTCGAMHSLESLCSDSRAREVMLVAAKLPAPLGERVMRYLGLFRPLGATPPRALAWPRVANLLSDLASHIDAASVTRHGRLWPAPLGYWSAALDAVFEARDAGSLKLPLKSHGYLIEIVVGIASKAEGKREQSAISQSRGETPPQGHQTPPTSTTSTSRSSATPRSTPPGEFRDLVRSLRDRGVTSTTGSQIPGDYPDINP